MRYFFDTEFLEASAPDFSHIELISLAIVAEDGRSLYVENAGFDWEQPMPDDWLADNVRPHLRGPGHDSWCDVAQMAERVRAFVGEEPEFWAYVGASDWMALLSLYGRLIDRPKGWPSYCCDLKQLRDMLDLTKSDLPPIDPASAHDALADAEWNRQAYIAMQHVISERARIATSQMADAAWQLALQRHS